MHCFETHLPHPPLFKITSHSKAFYFSFKFPLSRLLIRLNIFCSVHSWKAFPRERVRPPSTPRTGGWEGEEVLWNLPHALYLLILHPAPDPFFWRLLYSSLVYFIWPPAFFLSDPSLGNASRKHRGPWLFLKWKSRIWWQPHHTFNNMSISILPFQYDILVFHSPSIILWLSFVITTGWLPNSYVLLSEGTIVCACGFYFKEQAKVQYF